MSPLDQKDIASTLPCVTFDIRTIILKKNGTEEREKTIAETKYRYGPGYNANDLNAENATFCCSYHGCIAQCLHIPAQSKYCESSSTQ